MNRKLGIQNFRVFDDKGAQFKLAPITVLTGCNSSGKSSVIKAIMLFEDFFKRLKIDYKSGNLRDVLSYPLKLNEGEHKLAKFNYTLNNKSESDEMVFSFTRHSLFADSEIDIEFVFKGNKNNILGNGILNKLRIKRGDTYIYVYSFDAPEGEKSLSIDHQVFKDMYFNFLKEVSEKENTNGDKLDSDTFSVDFSFYINQYMNDMYRQNILFKSLSNVSGDSKIMLDNPAYLYLRKSSDEKIEKLISYFESLKGKDLTSKTLFNSPAYSYLKGATKENIKELIAAKIGGNNEVCYNIELYKENIIKQLSHIVNSFIESKHIYLKDYFTELEDDYFKKQYTNIIDIEDNFLYSLPNLQDKSVSIDFIEKTKDALTLYYIGSSGAFTDFDLNNLSREELFENFEQFCVTMFGFSEFVTPGYYEDVANTNYYEDIGADGDGMYMNQQELMGINDHEKWLEYINFFVEDAFFNLPDFIDNVEFINSNRPKVERFYDLSNLSGSFANLINDYVSFNSKEIPLKGDKKYMLGDFLRKWVKEFEIADDVVFESTREGLGIFIYLLNDGKQKLLADLGYGITQVLSMLLKIELSILENFELNKSDAILGNINFELYTQENKLQTITIEEPEANLHPKLQSKLADMFMEASELYNINFILETHSEYLIRKFQYLVANPNSKAKPEDISIYYLYNPNAVPKGKKQVELLEIRPDGILKQDFGEGFFDEASNLTFELLKLQNPN